MTAIVQPAEQKNELTESGVQECRATTKFSPEIRTQSIGKMPTAPDTQLNMNELYQIFFLFPFSEISDSEKK